MSKNLPARLREKCAFNEENGAIACQAHCDDYRKDNRDCHGHDFGNAWRMGAKHENARLVPILERLISLAELVLAEECPITQSTAYVKCKCLRCGRLNALRDCLGEE